MDYEGDREESEEAWEATMELQHFEEEITLPYAIMCVIKYHLPPKKTHLQLTVGLIVRDRF